MMKKILTIVACVLCASILSARAGEVVTDSISSSILKTTVKFNVYLPDGFSENPKMKYPSVYLLHGLYGTYEDWTKLGNMQLVADELIETGEADSMVIIMPNAGDPDIHGKWNGYFNMPGWSYEDFFFKELIPIVEARYRCYGDKEHRAVMGLSMGGGGSTVYCQHHPDMFSSCYAMSAWMDTDQLGGDTDDMEKDKFYYECVSVRENSALDFMDKASEETLSRLRTVKWFFDCGDDDFLVELSMEMHLKMREAKIKDELRVRNGVHNWEYWHTALRAALPFASRNFAH